MLNEKQMKQLLKTGDLGDQEVPVGLLRGQSTQSLINAYENKLKATEKRKAEKLKSAAKSSKAKSSAGSTNTADPKEK